MCASGVGRRLHAQQRPQVLRIFQVVRNLSFFLSFLLFNYFSFYLAHTHTYSYLLLISFFSFCRLVECWQCLRQSSLLAVQLQGARVQWSSLGGRGLHVLPQQRAQRGQAGCASAGQCGGLCLLLSVLLDRRQCRASVGRGRRRPAMGVFGSLTPHCSLTDCRRDVTIMNW